MLKRTLAALFVCAVLPHAVCLANDQQPIRVGVLTDMSGPYRDQVGQGVVVAAQLAIEDLGGKVLGRNIELLVADHQNKPDIGAGIVRKWFDVDGVDAVLDLGNSAVALAVMELGRGKQKVILATGASSSDITGKFCSPTTIQWTTDSWMQTHATTSVVSGSESTWFMISSDYAFGRALERDATRFIEASGGKVVGSVRAPLNNMDFSSFILQAQSSGSKWIGLANAGTDTTNTIKQAAEFNIEGSGQKVAAFAMTITDVDGLGLEKAQGLIFSTNFYWDLNERTRNWSRRFSSKMGGKQANRLQASAYGGLLAYLKSIQGAGSTDALAVVGKMKNLPTDDDAFGAGTIRADGRAIHPVYVLQVKRPAESKGPWDYAKVIKIVPSESAPRPLQDGECSLGQSK